MENKEVKKTKLKINMGLNIQRLKIIICPI